MAKLFRIRDYLLICAALTGDLFDEIRLFGGAIPSVMRERYGIVPDKFKRSSYSTTISQMLSTGNIKKVVDNNGCIHLQLTSVGKKKFVRRFPLFMQSKKWDGIFMVAIFDIEEKSRSTRNLLRQKLVELGFGMLQKSVWISPYHFEEDLREFLIENGLEDSVFVLSTKKLWVGDLKRMANEIWKLDRINEGYKDVIDMIGNLDVTKKSKIKNIIRKAWGRYLEVLISDPVLPKEFLPVDWQREKAINSLNKTIKRIENLE